MAAVKAPEVAASQVAKQIPVPEELTAAKILAFGLRPYLAESINALITIMKPGLGTMGVDEFYRLYVDPEVFKKWTVRQAAGVIIHECGHKVREHHPRARIAGNVNHKLWNVAGDLEINDDLVKEGLELPTVKLGGKKKLDVLTPDLFGYPDGEFIENYYQRLIQDQKAQDIIDIFQADADGNEDGEGGMPDPSRGMCGSCAHGQRMPWDLGGGDDTTPGVSEAESEMISRQVARNILEGDAKGKQAGNISAGWVRWAKKHLKAKVDYRRMIRAAVRGGVAEAEGKNDYSWKRPARRQQAYGRFVMPGRRSPRPRIGIGIDTSGSMSDEQLAQALAEVKGALNAAGRTDDGLYVVTCDYSVHTVQKVFNVNQIEMKGGGGTDMGAAISKLVELRPKVGLIILLTDCETPWPAKPNVPVVVVKIAGSGAPPPWPCRLVEIDLTEF